MIIKRLQIIELIDPAVRKTVAIIAPPGYGKTTLLKQLVELSNKQYIYLRLDRFKQDLTCFAAYMLDELRASVKDKDLDELIESVQNSDIKLAKDIYWQINKTIRRLYQNRILIALDDLHEVESDPEVYELINIMIKNSGDNVQFIYCSRKRPILPAIEYLSVRGMHFEVSAADLRFNFEEMQLMLASGSVANTKLSISEVETATHGWPFILALIARSKEGAFCLHKDQVFNPDAEDTLDTFLYSQVYRPLQLPVQATLMRLWPFPTIDLNDQEFCELVSLTDDDVRKLKKAGLPIDFDINTGTMVLHPLFRGFLRDRFKREYGSDIAYVQELVELYVARAQFDKAIDICVQHRDYEEAEHLMLTYADDLLASGHRQFYENTLRKLNSAEANRAVTSFIEAKLVYQQGDYHRAFKILKRILETLPEQKDTIAVQSLNIQVILDLHDINLWHFVQDDVVNCLFADLHACCKKDWDINLTAIYYVLQIRTSMSQSDWDGFVQYGDKLVALVKSLGDFKQSVQRRLISMAIAVTSVLKSKYQECSLPLDVDKPLGCYGLLMLNNFAACEIEKAQYEKARSYLRIAVRNHAINYDKFIIPVVLGTFADVLAVSIEQPIMKRLYRYLLIRFRRINDVDSIADVYISAANYFRRKLNNSESNRYCKLLSRIQNRTQLFNKEFYVKIVLLLHEIKVSNRESDIDRIKELRDVARLRGVTICDVQLTFILAVIYSRVSEWGLWKAELTHCMEEAIKYEYHHFMIQEGCLYPIMYYKAAELNIHKTEVLEYINRMGPSCIVGLLDAFEDVNDESKLMIIDKLSDLGTKESFEALRKLQRIAPPLRATIKAKLSQCYEKAIESGSSQLIKHLTAKENEVLAHMANGLTNKEISAALFISEKTLKTHINRVFFKLNVANRIEAIRLFSTMNR